MNRWALALEQFEDAHAATVAASTLRPRMARLRRMARELGGVPGEIEPEQFETWLAALQAPAKTVKANRLAARAFFGWAVDQGLMDRSPVPVPGSARRYTLGERWADALKQFERAQIAQQLASGTIENRMIVLRRFAGTIDREPWHVLAEDYGAWVVSQQISRTRRASYRQSLRAFYRWAHGTGRIDVDPTVEPESRRTLGVPEQWASCIQAWRRWLIGSGQSSASVGQRVAQLESFARAHRSADPWGITTDDIFDYMAGKSWARETRRGFRVAVRAFYGWGQTTGRTDTDPTEAMPRVKSGDPSRRPASVSEYRAALGAAADPRWRLALRLACELGMRRGEIAQAHSRDVLRDDNGGTWLTVHGKGGKVRRLPVPSNLAASIEGAGEGYLFPSTAGKHMTAGYVGKQMSRYLPNGVSAHALRHAFATRAYNVNRDVFTVQRLLGHASAATTQRYVQVSDDTMRALVDAAQI